MLLVLNRAQRNCAHWASLVVKIVHTLEDPETALSEIAHLLCRRKGKVAALRVVEINDLIVSVKDTVEDTRHAVSAVPLGARDEVIQAFIRLDHHLFLEERFAFVYRFVHIVNGYTDTLLVMKELPERRHHSFVSWQWRVMDVDAPHRRNGKHWRLEDVGAGNRDKQIGGAFLESLPKRNLVGIADSSARDAIGFAKLAQCVVVLGSPPARQEAKDARPEQSRKDTQDADAAIESSQLFEELLSRTLSHGRTKRDPGDRKYVIVVLEEFLEEGEHVERVVIYDKFNFCCCSVGDH